jgi:hypothetical protein
MLMKSHEKTPSSGSQKRAVLVLGMHRSGTSALARIVSLLGAGAPANLLPPNDANPAGFWESRLVYELSEELLKAAGSSWDDWRPIEPDWLRGTEAAQFRARMNGVVQSEYAGSSLLAIKDPRICRLMTFWLELLRDMEIAPSALVVFRNPVEVAASLKQRDGFPAGKAMLLWLRHVLDAEYFSRGLPRGFLSYKDLMTDWRAALTRAGRQSGIEWPDLSGRGGKEIDKFLSPEFYRARADDDALAGDPHILSWLRSTFAQMDRLCRDPQDADARHALDAIRGEFDSACKAFSVAARAETAAALDAAMLAARKEASRQSELAMAAAREQQAEIGQLLGRITTLEAKSAAAEQRWRAEIGEKQNALTAAHEDNRKSVAALANLDARLTLARAKAADAELQLNSFAQIVGQQSAVIRRLQRELLPPKDVRTLQLFSTLLAARFSSRLRSILPGRLAQVIKSRILRQ